MSLLTGTYLLIVGRGGLVFVTFLCATFVVLLRPVVSAPLVVALCAAVILLPEYVAAWDVTGQQWIIGTPALLISLAMCGVRANAVTQIALFQARAEVEQLAAERERLRIVRDLHDLLGHSLTTVVVKAELALRLVSRDPDRAAAEMADVADLARQGLADVRATVAGHREVSLAGELATAREVLRAARIHAELPTAVDGVSGGGCASASAGWCAKASPTRCGAGRPNCGSGWPAAPSRLRTTGWEPTAQSQSAAVG